MSSDPASATLSALDQLQADIATPETLKAAQEAGLVKALEACKDTALGRRNGLGTMIKTAEEFKALHPLSSFRDIADLVAEACTGKPDVLFPGVPVFIGVTGGTTGTPKRIPSSPEYVAHVMDVFPLAYKVSGLGSSPPPRSAPNPVLFWFVPDIITAPHGIRMGGVGLNTMKGILGRMPASALVSPKAVFTEAGTMQGCFMLHLLFGLANRDVSSLTFLFLPQALMVKQALERHGPELVTAIRAGELPSFLTTAGVPDTLLASLRDVWEPNPERATEVEMALASGMNGVYKRLWPSLTHVKALCGGPLLRRVPELVQVLGEGVLLGPGMGVSGTEGLHTLPFHGFFTGQEPEFRGVEMWTTTFSPPRGAFHEFFPLDEPGEDWNSPGAASRLLGLHELEVGKSYALVITSPLKGLWRYRLGDTYKVVGMKEALPELLLTGRLGVAKLNQINIYEHQIAATVDQASAATGAKLGRFTVAASVLDGSCSGEELPPHLLLFVEMDAGTDSQAFVNAFEDGLRRLYPCYSLAVHGIGPARLFEVPKDAFDAALDARPGGRGPQTKLAVVSEPDSPDIAILRDGAFSDVVATV